MSLKFSWTCGKCWAKMKWVGINGKNRVANNFLLGHTRPWICYPEYKYPSCRIFDKFSLLLKELETYPDFNYDKLEEAIQNHQRKEGEAYKVTFGHFSKLKHHFIKELEMYVVIRKLNKKSTSLCLMAIQKFLLHLEIECEGN